ncbi:hypothetical protein ACIS_00726 [Anaplasma centrale str. Israel]|uniref:Uncharacterized protein n=2 Tax=Anaplasma centrale TaxID=769 RepID=D1AUQ9_ANACI|nr:hypothetical protein ACIS_00726 [Anaplasma centrale str. Israel]
MLVKEEECAPNNPTQPAMAPQKRRVVLLQSHTLRATARAVFISYWFCVCMAYFLALAWPTVPREASLTLFAAASVLAICGYTMASYLTVRRNQQGHAHTKALARLEKVDVFASCAEAVIVIGLSAASLGFMLSGITTPRYFAVIGCFASMCAILSKVASMSAGHVQLQLESQYMDKEEYYSRLRTSRTLKIFGCFSIALGAVSICMSIASISSDSVHVGGLAWNIAKAIASCGWLTTAVGSFVLIRMTQRNRCYQRLLSECEVSAVSETLAVEDKKKSAKNALIALGKCQTR